MNWSIGSRIDVKARRISLKPWGLTKLLKQNKEVDRILQEAKNAQKPENPSHTG